MSVGVRAAHTKQAGRWAAQAGNFVTYSQLLGICSAAVWHSSPVPTAWGFKPPVLWFDPVGALYSGVVSAVR